MEIGLHELIHIFAVMAVSGVILGSKENLLQTLVHAEITAEDQKQKLYRNIRKSRLMDRYLKFKKPVEIISGVTEEVDKRYIDESNALALIYADVFQQGGDGIKKLADIDNAFRNFSECKARTNANFKSLSLFTGLVTFVFLIMASFCPPHHHFYSDSYQESWCEISDTEKYLLSMISVLNIGLQVVIGYFLFTTIFLKSKHFIKPLYSIYLFLVLLIVSLFWSQTLAEVSNNKQLHYSVVLIISPIVIAVLSIAIMNGLFRAKSLWHQWVLRNKLKNFLDSKSL